MTTTPPKRATQPRRMPRRMPRANAPHPDESLAGYLLNLAYRLDLTPSALLKRTGLKNRASLLDVQYAIGLPPDQTTAFAAATHLTTTEVRNLTLERFQGTLYDPQTNTSLARTLHSNLWVNLAHTRYCPHCLHTPTNPSEPPHALWRTQWLTPWAVACVEHRCLLLDTCTECGTPTGQGDRHAKSAVPNIYKHVEHPAACRAALTATRLCGHRLDTTTAPPAPQTLLDTQRTLNNLMAGQHNPLTSLGQIVDGPQYLRDLRLVMVLIQMAQDTTIIGTNNPYRTNVLEHLHERSQHLTQSSRANRTLTKPPTDTPVAAGLLLAATALLSQPENSTALTDLTKQAAHHEKQPWKKAHATARASAALTNAILDTRNAITDPRRIRAFTTTPEYTITPNNVAAYLPHNLYAEHFADTDPVHERPIRRWVPIAISRLLTDQPTAHAAALLGYDPTAAEAAAARASNAFDTLGHDTLRRRVATITDYLEHTPHTDYQQLRDHFDPHWLIPDPLWQHLQTTLTAQRLVRADTPWTRRRPAYAAWIWSLVTQGDVLLAPMIQTTNDVRRNTGGIAHVISDLHRRTPPAHHRTVHDLASQITAAIS